MSAEASTPDGGTNPESIAHDALDADDVQLLGIDQEGSCHYYTRRGHRLVAIATDGTIERDIDIEASGRFTKWILFVDDKRGWSQLNYHETFGDILNEALGGTD